MGTWSVVAFKEKRSHLVSLMAITETSHSVVASEYPALLLSRAAATTRLAVVGASWR